MRSKASLTKLTAIYFIGNLSSKAFSFILMFYATHFINATALGEYDIILNTLSFIIPLITLQSTSALFRWMIEEREESVQKLIVQNVITLLIGTISVFTLVFCLLSAAFVFKYPGYIYFISVCQVLVSFFQQILRGKGRNLLFVLSGVYISIITTFISFLTLSFSDLGLEGLLMANTIALMIGIIYLLTRPEINECMTFKISFVYLKEMLGYSLPLIPNTFSWWIITSANRYFILFYLGKEANGIFAISFRFPTLILMFSEIFYIAWQEHALKVDGYNELSETSVLLKKYLKLLFSIGILLACFSKPILKIAVSPRYAESWKYIPILLLACVIQALVGFYGVAYLKSKKTYQAFTTMFYGVAVAIISQSLLISDYGLYGVSLSVLIGFSLVLVLRAVKLQNDGFADFPIALFSLLTACFLLVSFINHFEYGWLSLFSVIFTISVVGFSNLETFKKLWTFCRNL